TDRNSARDNPLLAFLTYGEGYHNFHHIFENDYRNGIHWWDYDPTKWLIRGLAYCGLAKDLRKVPQERIESAKLQMQLKRSQSRVARHQNADELLEKLQLEYERLKQQLIAYYEAKKELLDAKRERLCVNELHQRVASLKAGLKLQRQSWNTLTAICR
ncbi:MAG: hypothetical protein ACRC7Q_01710, partial [Plesiomonas shigelloides]